MIKKLTAFLLSVICVISFACCGGNNSGGGSSDSGDSSSTGGGSSEVVNTTFEEIPVAPEYEKEKTDGYEVIYFDSVGGDDQSDGKTEATARRSLSAINSAIATVTEDTPTKILIKAGSEYQGTLAVKNFTASDEYPLIVSVYGVTDTAKYAKIEGVKVDNDGNTTYADSCVEVTGSNVRISGLELTSKNGLRGFYVYTSKAGANKNVVISGNYIHDVNFDFEAGLPQDLQGKGLLPGDAEIEEADKAGKLDFTAMCPTARYTHATGGIYFIAGTQSSIGASWFENVWIENNTIERVSRDGIWIDSYWAKRPGLDWGNNRYVSDDNGWYPHRNVNVMYNDILYTGDGGACILATIDGFMEGNLCFHAGYLMRSGMYCAGLWLHSCKNVVMQFNEASYTHLRGGGDGEGFDIDIGNSDILFQYNYSHHNEGGGILLCNIWTKIAVLKEDGKPELDEDGLPIRENRYAYWGEIYLRNNVFADNGRTIFHIQGGIQNLYIENNTMVIAGDSSSDGIVRSNVWGDATIHGENWQFVNNIFYLRNKRKIVCDLEYCPEAIIKNNVFSNFDDSLFEYLNDKTGSYDFKTSGTKIYDTALSGAVSADGFDTLKTFVSQVDACYTDGVAIEKMARYDLLGNAATNKYVGAFASKGE